MRDGWKVFSYLGTLSGVVEVALDACVGEKLSGGKEGGRGGR